MNERVRLWFLATRPFSLTAAIVPVLVGTVVGAANGFSIARFLLALVGSVALQAGTNLVNDYYDHVKGVDDVAAGPVGLIQRGLIAPRTVLMMGIVWFGVGAVAGLALVAQTGPSLLWLGLASVLAGFFYTGAPISLAYLGLGELTVFIFMGPVIVSGAAFVQSEQWSWTPVIISLPIAFIVTAILHANNLRDIDNDRAHHKRTVATLIGRRAATYEYLLLIGGAYAALIVAVLLGVAAWPALVALVTLPAAVKVVRRAMRTTNPRALNYVLYNTAQLHTRFGVLLAAGLVAGLWVS